MKNFSTIQDGPSVMSDYHKEWHRQNPNYRADYYEKNRTHILRQHKIYYKNVICEKNERDKEIGRDKNNVSHRKRYFINKIKDRQRKLGLI